MSSSLAKNLSGLLGIPVSELMAPELTPKPRYAVAIGNILVHFTDDGDWRNAIAACPAYPATHFSTWAEADQMARDRKLDPATFTIRRQ